MIFNLFRNREPRQNRQTAAAEGFQTLVDGVKGILLIELPNKYASLLTACVVEMSVRVVLNVSIALKELNQPFRNQYPLTRPPSRNSRPASPVPAEKFQKAGQISLKQHPLKTLESISTLRSEGGNEDAESSSGCSDGSDATFTFNEPRFGAAPLFADLSEEEDEEEIARTLTFGQASSLKQTSSLTTIPEHKLLKGFIRTASTSDHPTNYELPQEINRRVYRSHARHLSLDDNDQYNISFDWNKDFFASNPPTSPFDQAKLDLSVTEEEHTEEVTVEDPKPQNVDDDNKEQEDSKKCSIKSNPEPEPVTEPKPEMDTATKIEEPVVKTAAKIKTQTKAPEAIRKERPNDTEQDIAAASPCSSPRSVFSDSDATKYNVNFCNPAFLEESEVQSPMFKGSIRQRYTMKRLQSLLSQRSRTTVLTPQSVDEDASVATSRPPLSPSMRSFRKSFKDSFRGSIKGTFGGRNLNSFRCRGGEDVVLSDAYRMVRLETCIRKAWQISMDDAPSEGCQTLRGEKASKLNSFRKLKSRRFNKSQRISFVRVPADFSNEMLMSKRDMLLNPAFGDDEVDTQPETDVELDPSVDGETIVDTASVVMRTPLRRMGSVNKDAEYQKCVKNLDEGAYDNPLRLCSFRSYDSDTELELASVRARNPISRLLSFRNRGITTDGISLAEIDGDEYGALMFDQVNQNPIGKSMLEKYLTQLVIDDAIDVNKGDCYDPVDDEVGWSTCQQEWVPQELDDELKCLLMDRFLLDNILTEMDVNMSALELARVKQRSHGGQAPRRVLRRS